MVPNEPQYFSFRLDKIIDGPSKPSTVIIELPSKIVSLSPPETAMPPIIHPTNSNDFAPHLDEHIKSR